MYISIDTETTGLDPETCQVLQLAAVAWTDDDINKCWTFDFVVDPTKGSYRDSHYGGPIQGEAYALNMNAGLLKRIAAGEGYAACAVSNEFIGWLSSMTQYEGMPDKEFTVVGANFGSFDLQFLKAMPGYPIGAFKHRILDVGSMYATKAGIPSTAEIFPEIANRWDIKGNAHEALYDAKVTLAAAMEKLA